jgi:hypothetical protein
MGQLEVSDIEGKALGLRDSHGECRGQLADVAILRENGYAHATDRSLRNTSG